MNEHIPENNDEQMNVVDQGDEVDDVAQNDKSKSTRHIPVIFILGIFIATCFIVVIAVLLFNRFSATDPVVGVVDVTNVQDVPDIEAEDSRVIENKNDYDYNVLMLFDDDDLGHYFGRVGDGLTLYVSRAEDCADNCNQNMEPYLTDVPYDSASEQQLGTVELKSGDYQYVWQGKKLFIYNQDEMTGDVLGDGLDDSWTIARP